MGRREEACLRMLARLIAPTTIVLPGLVSAAALTRGPFLQPASAHASLAS